MKRKGTSCLVNNLLHEAYGVLIKSESGNAFTGQLNVEVSLNVCCNVLLNSSGVLKIRRLQKAFITRHHNLLKRFRQQPCCDMALSFVSPCWFS